MVIVFKIYIYIYIYIYIFCIVSLLLLFSMLKKSLMLFENISNEIQNQNLESIGKCGGKERNAGKVNEVFGTNVRSDKM